MDDNGLWVKVNVHWIILFVFFGVFIAFTVWHFTLDPASDPRFLSFIGGLAAAFFVAFIQFGLQIFDQIRLSRFRKNGVLDFLQDRTDKEFYRELINSATKGSCIQVSGVTCNRMLVDFADFDVRKSQNLIDALSNGVSVQILIPKVQYLSPSQASDFINKTFVSAERLMADYPALFQIKYFDSRPSHSMFAAGGKCVIGPIFEEKSSKDTPAIVFDRYGAFVDPYIQNFEKIWARASDSYE